MAAKTQSSLCFINFLKEALILPTRNPKLFMPVFLLLAVATFLARSVHVVFIQPLADDMARSIHLIEMRNTGVSCAECDKLGEGAIKIMLISIAQVILMVALGFVKKVLAFFAASTTYSGDCYSLAELTRKVICKGNSLKGPSITFPVVTALGLAWTAVLVAMRTGAAVMMRGGHSRVLTAVQGLVFLLTFLAELCFAVVALVSVAASVVDGERRGVRALRQAWRLMTRVRRKEGLLLVFLTYLLPTVVAPVYRAALVHSRRSMATGLCVLAAYALLFGALQLVYLTAATVFYYEAMETKEAVPCHYAEIPSGEGDV